MSRGRKSSWPFDEKRDWIPPSDYLEALRERVLPIYAELLEDSRIRSGPFDWSEAWKEEEDPGLPDLGPWDLGHEPWRTDLHFLFHNLEGRRDSRARWPEEKEDLLQPLRKIPKLAAWAEDLLEGTLKLHEPFPENFPVLIRLRDTLLEVLEKTRPYEVEDCPSFRDFLDGTVRTLYAWTASPSSGADTWHPPVLRWGGPCPEDNRDLPLRERLEATSGCLPKMPASDARRVWAGLAETLDYDPLPKYLSILGASEDLPRAARDPFALRLVVAALITLHEFGRAESVRKDREDLAALGRGRLLSRTMRWGDRWRRERVLSDWLDELRYVERLTEEAEETLRAAGFPGIRPMEGTTELDATFPSSPTKPRDLYGRLVEALYRHFWIERHGEGPLGHDEEVRRDVACALSWVYFDDALLRTDTGGRIYSRMKRVIGAERFPENDGPERR